MAVPEERQLYEATRREVVQQVQKRRLPRPDARASGSDPAAPAPLLAPAATPERSQASRSWTRRCRRRRRSAMVIGARVQPVRRFVSPVAAASTAVDDRDLDGGCSAKSRQESILRFRHGVLLFLISLKAGAQA